MARPIEVPVVVKKGTLRRSIEGESAAAFRKMGSSGSAVAPLGRMLGKIRADADEFTKSIEASNARVIAFGASVGLINGISNAFKKLVQVTISVEKSLVDINVVMNAGSKELAKFGDGLFKVAKNTASSFDVVAEAATEFARQGLTTEETLKRVNDSLILTRLTGLKAADSVKGLTAAVNGFGKAGLTTTQIINKLAAVDVKFAVSADDLIDALSRTGAVAQDAGLSMDELIGMVTAAQQTTARGGAVIGNAFKTIFTRIQRPETLKTLRQLGIAVDDAAGKSLSARKVMEQLAISYDGLSKSAKDAVNQQVAGVFQINILKASIGDLQKQNSIAARATQISAAATDEATKKNQQLNTTIAALTTQTGLALSELAKKIGDIALAPGMRDIVSSFKALVEGTTGVLDGEGTGSRFAKGLLTGIGSVLTGPGLIVIGGVFIKLFKDLTVFGFKSLKNLLGLNNAAKAQAALQQGIGQLLATNVQYENAMAAAAGNLNKQALITQTYLAKEITMRAEAVALTSAMAGSAFAGGYRVTGAGEVSKKSKFFGGRRGKVPGLAPTDGGVPNFNPALGYALKGNVLKMRSRATLGTADPFSGTHNLNLTASKFAKKLPASMKAIVKDNAGVSGFSMETPLMGLTYGQQQGMVGSMSSYLNTRAAGSALAAKGVSSADMRALRAAHAPGGAFMRSSPSLDTINTRLGRMDTFRTGTKGRGAYEQMMSEKVTEPYMNRAFGARSLGGRQGKDTAIDSMIGNMPFELKKRMRSAGEPKGDTTIRSMMTKQMTSYHEPGLRNWFSENAGRNRGGFDKYLEQRFAKEYRAYFAGQPPRGGGFFTADPKTLNSAQMKDSVLGYHKAINFAPIGDAIQREKMQVGGLLGMPSSQVQTRVVQNTALKSSFNPQGFGVISPSVGQHSFADAARMHRGQDLRTVNMAPGDIIRPKIPDLSKVDWGKVETTPTGHRAPTPKFIMAGVTDIAAKDFGTATAKAITHEAKKAYPTARDRGIKIAPPVDKVKAAQMAAPTGGFGNSAMNAFMGYSVGTMVDPLAQDFLGTTAGFMPGAVGGGMLGHAGSKAAAARLGAGRMGRSSMGKKALKTLPYVGTALSAFAGGAAGAYDADAQAFLIKHGKTKEDRGYMAAADLIPGIMANEQDLGGRTANQVKKIKEQYRNQINYQRRMSLEGIRDTTAGTARGREFAQLDEVGRTAQLGRAARGGGISELDIVRRSAKIRRDTTAADQADKRQQFISQQSTGLVQGMGEFGYMGEGPEELRIRNLIRENLVRGNYGAVDEFFRSTANPETRGPGVIQSLRGGLGMELGKNTQGGTGLDPIEKAGFIQAGFSDAATGAIKPEVAARMGRTDIAKTIEAMGQSEQFQKMGTSVLKTAEAFKELEAGMDFAEKVAQLNDALDETSAKMKDVHRFTSGFSAGFADAFSNMTTGASSAKDAMRDFAMGVLRSINRIQSEKLAQQLTGYLFPEGGKGQGFLSKLFGGGEQTGGLIQAQNGMYVSGSRTGDKNPALLEDGEYVLNKKFVEGVGKENLDSMNFGMFPRFGKAARMQSGGRLVSPISRSGVKRSALDEIIKENEFLPPVTGLGSALGGGGISLRLGAEDPRLSGAAHSNDQTLQTVRGDIQEWHQEQREKKFEKQAKDDALVQMLVGAVVSAGVSAGIGAIGSKKPSGPNVGMSADQAFDLNKFDSNLGAVKVDASGAPIGGYGAYGGGTAKAPGIMAAIKQMGSSKVGAFAADAYSSPTPAGAFKRDFSTGEIPSWQKSSALPQGFKRDFSRGPDSAYGSPPPTPPSGPSGSGGMSAQALMKMGLASPEQGVNKAKAAQALKYMQVGENLAKGMDLRSSLKDAGLPSNVGSQEANPQSAGSGMMGFAQQMRNQLSRSQGIPATSRKYGRGLGSRTSMQAQGPGAVTQIAERMQRSAGLTPYPKGTPGASAAPRGAPGVTPKSMPDMEHLKGLWDFDPHEPIHPVTPYEFDPNLLRPPKWQVWPPKQQRGGYIDNIPAMLTGGEFVMSSSAVRRHGSGALNRLNRGGRVGYQEGGLVGDQQFVPAEGKSADKKQSGTTKSGDSNTTINITVNSSTGETNTSTNGEAGASEREMAVRLADAVKTVLKQEKRTGGMLRDVTSNDQ